MNTGTSNRVKFDIIPAAITIEKERPLFFRYGQANRTGSSTPNNDTLFPLLPEDSTDIMKPYSPSYNFLDCHNKYYFLVSLC